MATILPFPVKNVVPAWGLTERECDAVHATAFPLMQYGQSTGVSVHNDGQYMCVFDCRGEPYSIGREEGVCYLANPEETMVAYSRQFEVVLEALIEMLSPTPYTPT